MNKKEFDQIVVMAHFLERYAGQAAKARNNTFTFQGADQDEWKLYYEGILKPGILPDGIAFGESSNQTQLGVGSDGECYGDEYYQLLMQCYKYLYMALSSGEVFLKSKSWTTGDDQGTI